MKRDVNIFAANLDRLMTRCNIRNSTLATKLGVSRQVISQWRHGKSAPDPSREPLLAEILGCQPTDFSRNDAEASTPMLPIAQWAKRENIPLGRARKLFARGILHGSTGGGAGEMQYVPAELHAPADSGRLIRDARKPDWIEAFRVNLDWRMRDATISNQHVAMKTRVGVGSVCHWRSGEGYPVVERLPLIAEALGWSVEELLTPPPRDRVVQWTYRHAPAWPYKLESAA